MLVIQIYRSDICATLIELPKFMHFNWSAVVAVYFCIFLLQQTFCLLEVHLWVFKFFIGFIVLSLLGYLMFFYVWKSCSYDDFQGYHFCFHKYDLNVFIPIRGACFFIGFVIFVWIKFCWEDARFMNETFCVFSPTLLVVGVTVVMIVLAVLTLINHFD